MAIIQQGIKVHLSGKIRAIVILGLLLFVTTLPTNAQRSQIEQDLIPPASSPYNHFNGVNAMPVLSGDVFMPFIFRGHPQGTFLGKIVFTTLRSGTTYYELFMMNADGSDQVPLVQENSDNFSPEWSPDNSRIVFNKQTDQYGFETNEIYTMEADGTNQINLTNNDDYDGQAVWSPDGTRIAFVSRRDGNFNIYVMNVDGSNPVQLTDSYYSKGNPTWSPDSSKIAYITEFDGWDQIVVMNADGSNPVVIHSAEDLEFSGLTWSPDGSKFAFSSRLGSDPDTNNIFTIFANGGNLKQLTFQFNSAAPAWSADGTQLAYSYEEPDMYGDIYVMNADGSSSQQLTHHPARDAGPAWSN